MITLIRCLTYPKIDEKNLKESKYFVAKYLFPDPILNDEFQINASPSSVLNQVLPTYYLRNYLGITPWIIDLEKQRGYLDILEIEGKRTDGTITDFLNKMSFSAARRLHQLNEQQINDLAESIMEGLRPENIFGLFVSREDIFSPRAYADILHALERDISQKQIEQMFGAQRQNLYEFERTEQQKIDEAWSILAHRVVGT